MNTTDTRTLAYYDRNASVYSTRQPRHEDTEALDRFMELVPAGSSVCDLGCGNGWASASLIENGYSVKAVDGSDGLAAEAMRINNVAVEVATFDAFTFLSEFDGLWACWSLHHAPRAVFRNTLKQVAQSVRPGGLFFFSVKGGTSEGRDENDRLYSYFSRRELANIIEAVVDGHVLEHSSWCVDGDGEEGSLRHQIFIRIAD